MGLLKLAKFQVGSSKIVLDADFALPRRENLTIATTTEKSEQMKANMQ